MSLYDQLTSAGGTFPNVGRLASVSAGIIVGSIAAGFSAVISGVFEAFLIRPLTGLAAWVDAVISGSFGAVTSSVSQAGDQAVGFVGQFGVLGFLVALAISLATLYGVAWGIDKLREDA